VSERASQSVCVCVCACVHGGFGDANGSRVWWGRDAQSGRRGRQGSEAAVAVPGRQGIDKAGESGRRGREILIKLEADIRGRAAARQARWSSGGRERHTKEKGVRPNARVYIRRIEVHR
jgi:hypothetical protein